MVVENKKPKIFTCGEIEAKGRKPHTRTSPKTSPKILNLKTVDSAVMSFSLQNQLTRYDKAELMALKETKAAQSPPLCEINPRIVRLNILNEQNHSEDTEKAENQDLLPALNNNNWDSSNLMALFNNYQKAMLYPQGYNNSRPHLNQSSNRNVSWGDEMTPLESLEKVQVQYERKNFFDNITTTTTMRPQTRMGIGSFEYQKNRQQQHHATSCKGANRNQFFKNNSSFYKNTSTGTNETKSSDNDLMDKSYKNKKKNDADDEEEEPEWFSCPASRQDFVELHGFEDDESLHPNIPISTDGSRPSTPCQGSRGSISDMISADMHRAHRPNNDFKGSRASTSRQNPQTRYSQNRSNYQGHNNSSMFSKSSSFNSSNCSDNFNSSFNFEPIGSQRGNINPFFKLWKQKNQQENINFVTWMSRTMRTISDVENDVRPRGPEYGILSQQQNIYSSNGLTFPLGNHNVPQFFQNALHSSRLDSNVPTSTASSVPPRIPTREQLEQHTSEIMRNAIMRKHFRDDRKNPK